MLSLRKQWPFWISGVFVGVAEIMNYIVLEKPIGLTTGLVEMTAALEQTVAPGIDWWSRAYDPNVHWIIIGVVFGAWLVARAERESRGWVKYPARELVLAFVGGFVFSFGTRLAHGCTTHHFLGGLPSMSTASLLYLTTILPAGFLTFYLMSKMRIGYVFKGQENRATAEYGCKVGGKMELDGRACVASRDYNPRRDWLRVSILVLMFAFFMNAIVGSFVYGTEDGLFGWNYAISSIGWGLAIWLLLVGIVAGIGMAKTGFGTECAFMTPEVSMGLEHQENFFEKKWLIPGSTRVMFRSMSPFTAIFIEILMLWGAIMIGWQYFDIKLPLGMNPTWILLLGAACQGFGSVAMIGCEIRTYMRLGLGYMTAVAAFPGFLLGYLPYTLYVDFWEDLARDTTISRIKHVPDMFGHDPTVQAMVGIAYGILIVGLLVWSVKRGMRLTGFSFRDLMTHANDELTIKYFERFRSQSGDRKERATDSQRDRGDLSSPAPEGA
ncbi:MAG: YeeE/YedE family protein [Gammaproteobacteria bacterium]|nr:YeeE/YedE family protein [Gammaproteobacteria bacterium]